MAFSNPFAKFDERLEGRGSMIELSYDIYRQVEQRKLRWIARVQTLDQACERIDRLEAGDYLIYDFRQRTIVQNVVQSAVEQPLALAAD